MPLICVAIQALTLDQTLSQIQNLRDPDIIEIRFDFRAERIDPHEIIKAVDVPLIATNRSRDQGGATRETEEERIDTIIEACEAGYTYADMELTSPQLNYSVERIHRAGSKCIVSYHDFTNTLTLKELTLHYSKAKAVDGDLVKLIGTVNKYRENLVYLEFVADNQDCISFGMGRKGQPSRLLSPLMGGAFTYASAEEGKESAPGQLTLSRMRAIYRELGVEA
jgi:3-dehydroquinate dehydratase type I